MSEGPIKQWRDGFKVPLVSTSNAARVCGVSRIGTPYCGRRTSRTKADWAEVTCSDCIAARRADAASSTGGSNDDDR